VKEKIASWMRSAIGMVESKNIRVVRIADNMRNVAVTEGDKVEAQIKFGWEVDAYPVNEIAEAVAAVSQSDTNALVDEYYDKYDILLEGRDPEEFKKHVAVQAQIELGFERFLEEKNYQARYTFRRSWRIKTASGTCYPASYGKRIWFRSRGRLEGCRNGTSHEDNDCRHERCKRYINA